MNGLSWLLYFGGVVGNLQGLLIVTAVLGTIGVGIWTIVTSIEADEPAENARRGLRWLWVPLVAAAVACLIPSQQAIYLIAGSQMAETVITSPDGQEIYGLVKEKLKEVLQTAPSKR